MAYFSYTLGASLDPSADPLPARAKYLASKLPRDLAISPLTNDLEIPVRLLSGIDSLVQRIWIRLRFWLGEWFLDERLGVPWLQQILVKGADPRVIRAMLTKVVMSTPGVSRVAALDVRIDAPTRTIIVSRMTVVAEDGTTVDARNGKPFIVGQPGGA